MRGPRFFTSLISPATVTGLPPQGAAVASSSKAGEKPKFDFYRILPGGEEPVSENDLKQAARSAAKGQPDTGKDVYYIQAGSFQNPADADNQKARLAILGVESSVEPTVKGALADGDRGGNIAGAKAVGRAIAQRLLEKGVKQVVFDRNGFLYHGRVKAVADAARDAGLEF